MPLPVDTSRRSRRLEIWSDVECAGGVRKAVVPPDDRLDPRTEDSLDGTRQLTVDVPRGSSAWSAVKEQRILRVDYSDTEAREFRIRDVDEKVSQDGSRVGSLTAEGIRYDLVTRSALLERIEANGLVRPHFEVYQLPPADHVDLILGKVSPYSSDAPSYMAPGTIEPTARVDMIYDWDTPLSALQELLKTIEGTAELQVRRNGSTDYKVDILRQVGDSAPTVYFNLGRNVSAFRRRRTAKKQGSRVYPKGGGQAGEQADMAGARWPIASISGSTLTMEDELLNEDGQLVGLYLEAEDGSVVEVTGSTAPDQVTVADASAFAAGEVVRARRNAAGDELTYLESPSAVSAYGVIPKTHDRQDVPPVDNLAQNPYLTAWSSGTPDGWNVIGSPPVAENTNGQFTKKGGFSARLGDGTTKAAEGEGLETAAIDVQPTDEHPYFSAQAALWVVSGSVRVEMIDVTNGKTWPPPESEKRAVTDELGTWVERLGVSGVDDMKAAGTQQVKFRIVAAEPGTEFYLDAAMVTQTPSGRDTFYHALGSNRLWRAALDELTRHADPISTYELDVRDLTALDPGRWPDEEVYLGADVRARSQPLGIDVTRRVQRIRRDPFRPAELRVEVESEEERLSRRIARSRRRRRGEQEERPEETSRPADPSGFTGFFDDRVVLVWDDVEGAARYLIRTQGSGTTEMERWENGTPWASIADTQYVDADPQDATLDLSIRAVSETGRPSSGVQELTVTGEGQLVRENTKEDSNTGFVQVTPVWGDPGSRTFEIRWYGRDANTSFPGTADHTDTGVPHGGTREFSRALPEDHGMAIRYEVVDEATGILVQQKTVKFDRNKQPSHQSHTLVRIGGDVYLLHNGDSDWASLKYAKAVGDSPSEPTLTDIRNGVTVGGRAGRTLIHSGLPHGDELKVGVLGYSQTSASGLESEEAWRDEVFRPGTGEVLDTQPTAGIREDARDPDQIHFDLYVESGADVSNPDLRFRHRVKEGPANTGSWSSWTSVADSSDGTWIDRAVENVDRAGKHPRMLEVEVQDQAPASQPSAFVYHPIEPQNLGQSESDGGRVDDQEHTSGGDFPAGGAPTGAKAELDGRTGAGGNLPTDYVHAERRTPDGVTPVVAADGALKSGLYRPSDSASLENIISKLKSTGKGEASLTIDGFPALRGAELGGARDQESVSFGNAYSGPPDVTFFPQRGLSFDVQNDTVDLRQELIAQSLSKDGFSMKAKIVTGTQFTAIDDGFGEDPGTQDSAKDRTLTADGEVTYSNLEDADLPSVTYTVCYDVDTTTMDTDVLLTVHMEVNDGADSTNWTEVNSAGYDAGNTWNDEKLSADVALDANYDIRLRITYGPTVPSSLATVTAHSETGSPPGVEYNRDDGTTTVDMTPESADEIAYMARASS